MKAAMGRSLRKDAPELFKAVEKLFNARNKVAHYGKEPSLSEARDAVTAAVQLSEWLGDLPTPSE